MIKKWGNCEPKSGCFRGHFPLHFFDSMTAFVNGFSFEGDVLICQDLTKPNPVYLVLLGCRCYVSSGRTRTFGPCTHNRVFRGHFAICPPPGRVFPRGNREQAAFSKKIWQITGCGLHVHAKIRTHVRNENATAWRQSPRWGWGGGNPRSLGVFRVCPFCMRS